jgi:hypothetical protein
LRKRNFTQQGQGNPDKKDQNRFQCMLGWGMKFKNVVLKKGDSLKQALGQLG